MGQCQLNEIAGVRCVWCSGVGGLQKMLLQSEEQIPNNPFSVSNTVLYSVTHEEGFNVCIGSRRCPVVLTGVQLCG